MHVITEPTAKRPTLGYQRQKCWPNCKVYGIWYITFSSQTRIRPHVERGICPIAVVCTVVEILKANCSEKQEAQLPQRNSASAAHMEGG